MGIMSLKIKRYHQFQIQTGASYGSGFSFTTNFAKFKMGGIKMVQKIIYICDSLQIFYFILFKY